MATRVKQPKVKNEAKPEPKPKPDGQLKDLDPGVDKIDKVRGGPARCYDPRGAC